MHMRSRCETVGVVSAGLLLAAALAARAAGQVTERVSIDSLGVQGNGESDAPSLSADGRYVAFASYASNLVVGDLHPNGGVFVHDRQSGATERVNVSAIGVPGSNGSDPSISADGRYVAFESIDGNLVNGDTNLRYDVFVRDRQSGTTERVSLDSLGAQGNGDSGDLSLSYATRGYIAMSPDGRYVAFQSQASNLVSGDTNATSDLFVRDRQSGTTERVSLDSLGAQGNDDSLNPSLSADGRYVAFQSWASNLVSGDTNARRDVFVRDRQSGATVRVSVDSLGAQANGTSYIPSISADGRCVAFQSEASNLVSADTNGVRDVFVRDRCGPATSATFSGDGINADTIAPVSAVLGSSWSAPMTLGHAHGTAGPIVLKLRRSTVNGPNFPSPSGGRLTEILVAGPLYATLSGTHDGVTGDIAPQAIPGVFTLVGLAWAAQYMVIGGGYADLSQAVSGVVGCP